MSVNLQPIRGAVCKALPRSGDALGISVLGTATFIRWSDAFRRDRRASRDRLPDRIENPGRRSPPGFFVAPETLHPGMLDYRCSPLRRAGVCAGYESRRTPRAGV